jgi:ribosomal protein L7/L12
MGKGAAKLRLAVAVCLFLGWIGWLAYLVVKTHNPVVLSRPQFLVADVWVRGHLDGTSEKPQATFVVREVLWAKDNKDQSLTEKSIPVWDLPFAGKAQGWAGPRDYLLPLKKSQEGKSSVYQLTPLPPSPGFRPATVAIRLDSAGKKKDQVAELIVELTGLDLAAAKEKVKKMGSDIMKNVPPTEAEEIEKKFKDLDALVTPRPEESRIYPATPEALEQLNEIHTKEQQK